MNISGINNTISGMAMYKNVKVTEIDKTSSIKIVSDDPILSLSKEARDSMEFYKKTVTSKIGSSIVGGYVESENLKLEYEVRKSMEEQGFDVDEDYGKGYDENKNKLLKEMTADVHRMFHSGKDYYDKNGTFAGITNEDISKKTTSIEFKDLEILESVEKEISKLNKGEFATEAEYYDAVLEKIYDSDLSDKAKRSIGGYVEHLKTESLKGIELSKEDGESIQKIKEKVVLIKEEIAKKNKDNKDINWKKVLRLNKELSQIYLKYTK